MTGSVKAKPLEWADAVVDVATVPSAGTACSLEASAEDRRGISDRLDIPAVLDCKAVIALRPDSAGAVRVDGTLRALLTRTCVVTDGPVSEAIDEPFECVVVPEEPDPTPEEDAAAPDYEVAPDGTIDLADLAVQYLSLLMAPYPRSDEADTASASLADNPEEGAGDRQNPFAGLAGRLAGDGAGDGRN